MKRVTIQADQMALVFKDGQFSRLLGPGKYWLWLGEKLETYSINRRFEPKMDLDILLMDQSLAEQLEVFEVGEQEIAAHIRNKSFVSFLLSGRYAYWKQWTGNQFTILDTSDVEIPTDLDKSIINRLEGTFYITKVQVESYETGLLYIDNQLVRALSPGVYRFWKNNKLIGVRKVDLRNQQLEIAGQEMLTKDKAALRINFQTQYRVVDVNKALVDNKDYERQLYVNIQLALREYVGTFSLDELLANKEKAGVFVLDQIKERVEALGVEVLQAGIRDIILPGEVKEIMNQVLIAEKRAQANTIMRREETASTRSLLNTAKLMENNEMLFKLKEMEYMEKIAENVNNISVSGGAQVLDQLRELFSR